MTTETQALDQQHDLAEWLAEVTAAGEEVQRLIVSHFADPHPVLSEPLVDAIEGLIGLADHLSEIPDTKDLWDFAGKAEAMAESLWGSARTRSQWSADPQITRGNFLELLRLAAVAATEITKGCPLSHTKTIVLETVAELVKQGVNPRQIAAIHGWVEGGVPDLLKVREEAEKPGTHKSLTPTELTIPTDWPTRRPILGAVRKCWDSLRPPEPEGGTSLESSVWNRNRR